MISLLYKYKKILFFLTAGIFVVGTFFGLGSYFFSGVSRGTVADVGGSKISYERFSNEVSRVLNGMRDSNSEVNEVVEKMVKQEVFKEMVLEEILYQQAKKLKMGVSDFEISAEIQSTPQFRNQNYFDQRAYFQNIWANFHMTPGQYEDWRRKARMGSKLKQFLYSAVKVTPDEIKDYCSSLKKTAKNEDKQKCAQELRQEDFMENANYFLRQITSKMEVRNYLDTIEKAQAGR